MAQRRIVTALSKRTAERAMLDAKIAYAKSHIYIAVTIGRYLVAAKQLPCPSKDVALSPDSLITDRMATTYGFCYGDTVTYLDHEVKLKIIGAGSHDDLGILVAVKVYGRDDIPVHWHSPSDLTHFSQTD